MVDEIFCGYYGARTTWRYCGDLENSILEDIGKVIWDY